MAHEDNPAGFLFAKVKRSAARAQAASRLPQPPLDTSYPSTREFEGPGRIGPYDLICVNRIAIPLHNADVEGGTKLDLDKQKGKGQDYAHLIGRGYESERVKFTLLLFDDMLTGANWLTLYEQRVRDVLMPQKKVEMRNAVEIYYPLLAGDGIHSVVIEHRGSPRHIGKQQFTVEIEGVDLRTTKLGKSGGSATKKMVNDTALKSQGVAIGATKGTPADKQRGHP